MNEDTTLPHCAVCLAYASLDVLKTCKSCGALVCPSCLPYGDCCVLRDQEVAVE